MQATRSAATSRSACTSPAAISRARSTRSRSITAVSGNTIQSDGIYGVLLYDAPNNPVRPFTSLNRMLVKNQFGGQDDQLPQLSGRASTRAHRYRRRGPKVQARTPRRAMSCIGRSRDACGVGGEPEASPRARPMSCIEPGPGCRPCSNPRPNALTVAVRQRS